jgi:hypothetical protein
MIITNNVIRKTLWVLLVLLMLCVVFMGGCYGMAKLIYASRGCEQFYIDNTEMHTGIDIPQKLYIDCAYNKEQKTKMVYYVIDKPNVPMQRYISFSEFKPLRVFPFTSSRDTFHFNADTMLRLQQRNTLFTKEYKDQSGERYTALLDTSSGQVWLQLTYAD